MANILQKEFFDRPTTEIAQDLLGKFIVRPYNDHEWSAMITEVEAYDGPDDKASHAHKGLTERTAPMFDEAGIFYIYLIYGIHWMLNIVTGSKNYPAAILIRSALVMLPTGEIEHIDGPAKLTKFFKIDKSFNKKQAAQATGLWFEDRGIAIPREHIIKRKRIGVDYAAEWKDALYNFSIEVAQNKEPS